MSIYDVKDVLHRIRVRLYRSNLPRAQGAYYARPANEAALSVEKVAAALKNRGGFTGSYSDLVQHVRLFFEEMAYQLCDGYAVNTGWFLIQPVIGGLFESPEDGFDPKKHRVSFRYRTSSRLRRLSENVEIEIEGAAEGGWIEFFTDIDSGSVNQTVTPEGLFSAQGRKIKVTGNSPDCGVWFVSKADPSRRYKVARALADNKSARITGLVPALPAGEYGVEIVTCYTVGGIDLKEPKTVTSGFTVRTG
jgi:hypothetical protein